MNDEAKMRFLTNEKNFSMDDKDWAKLMQRYKDLCTAVPLWRYESMIKALGWVMCAVTVSLLIYTLSSVQ